MHTSIYPVLAAQTRLPFYLSGAGISDPEYHVVRPDGLVSCQILFTRSGSGVLRIDGREIPQTPGSLFFLTPGVPHEYFPDGGGMWKTAWVVFRGEYLRELVAGMGFSAWKAVSGVDLSGCERIFSRIMSVAADPLSGGERCSVLVYEGAFPAVRGFPGGRTDRPGGTVHGRKLQPGYHPGGTVAAVRSVPSALLPGIPVPDGNAPDGIPRAAQGG